LIKLQSGEKPPVSGHERPRVLNGSNETRLLAPLCAQSVYIELSLRIFSAGNTSMNFDIVCFVITLLNNN